jgi:polar amino acid transport system substrate-binding protein
MKPIFRRSLHAALAGSPFAVAATLAAPAPAQAQQPGILQQVLSRGTVRIGVLASLPPYAQMTPSGQPEGYDIDIANMLAKDLKVKPEFVVTDIPTRVTGLQTRKFDLVIADFTRNVERSTTIAFTDPYMVTSMKALARADCPAKTIADLNDEKFRIALDRGGTDEVAVPPVLPKAQLIRFNAEADELASVLNGQTDAMAEDTLYNHRQIALHPGQLKELEGAFASAEIAIGLPAGDFDWWRVINLWVHRFNATGDNARLFRKWFGFDLPRIQAQY